MNNKYIVKVDDNYHYGDENERYSAGAFDSLAEALKKCEEITLKSLRDLYKDGITADELKAQWLMFGEDPFIAGQVKGVPFSAREFVDSKRCEKMIEECRRKKPI